MAPRELKPGLWRWTAPHPDWRANAPAGSSSDWPREVGCALYESGDAAVFIDPLVPAAAEQTFWRWADERTGGGPVRVLTTISFHRRSRDAFVARYGAETSRAKRGLPAGVESVPLPGAGETLFWLPAARTLIAGDRLIGAPGGTLGICPPSWLRYLPSGMSVAGLRRLLLPLLDLPIEAVLVSHGQPVLKDGLAVLARALA
ncbi:MAG: hypothetical protein ACYDHN_04610 [Solirubrobacteraceae bacterium]